MREEVRDLPGLMCGQEGTCGVAWWTVMQPEREQMDGVQGPASSCADWKERGLGDEFQVTCCQSCVDKEEDI